MGTLEKLKQIRQDGKITLRELAEKTELSANYLSQVERGIANPSLGTLRRITDALGVPFMALAEGEDRPPAAVANEPVVVRADRRKTLVYPGGRRRAELLTPDLKGKLEVLLCVEEPESPAAVDWYSHAGEECGFVLEGTYEVTIEDQVYLLNEGDSIRFASTQRHKLRNPGDKPCRLLWVITPPSF